MKIIAYLFRKICSGPSSPATAREPLPCDIAWRRVTKYALRRGIFEISDLPARTGSAENTRRLKKIKMRPDGHT